MFFAGCKSEGPGPEASECKGTKNNKKRNKLNEMNSARKLINLIFIAIRLNSSQKELFSFEFEKLSNGNSFNHHLNCE